MLHISFLIEGGLFSFMVWQRIYTKRYFGIFLFIVWSFITYFFWNQNNHKYDHVVSIPNQTHITYKVFYGKEQYIVRHPISWDGSQWINDNWSKDHCNAIYGDDKNGWVFKLDGSFVSNDYLFFHPGICEAVQLYLDKIAEKERRHDWGY